MTPDGPHSDWGIKMEVLNVGFLKLVCMNLSSFALVDYLIFPSFSTTKALTVTHIYSFVQGLPNYFQRAQYYICFILFVRRCRLW